MPTLPPPGQVRCIPVIVPGADARSAADWWVKVVYPVDHYPADPPGGERVVTVCKGKLILPAAQKLIVIDSIVSVVCLC